MLTLYDHQLSALKRMRNGCILNGDTGSGKSLTAIAYFYLQSGGVYDCLVNGSDYIPCKNKPRDLYIITTAGKRDRKEWQGELANFMMSPDKDCNLYNNDIVIDSWNNIQKYEDVKDAFFIFDEQRVVGKGPWATTFVKIAKFNKWILLSATPGDTWLDYIPVFIANGFYKNRSQFEREHIVWKRFAKFPQIDTRYGDKGYLNTGRLIRLRRRILIDMEDCRHTVPHYETIWCKYPVKEYKDISRYRFNPYTNEPIATASEYCQLLRRVVNSDESRQVALLELLEKHPKAIVFYSFDYELDIIKTILAGKNVAEWNGHAHEDIPETDEWVYLVQYIAGCEGWNCIKTDTVIFYSQQYAWKVQHQAEGRINRLNTRFTDLYYYTLKSRSGIDLAISKALETKEKFNESRYERGYYG